MLKLVWTLRCGSPRLRPRSSSWCIPNHQTISACSSVAAASEVKSVKASEKKSTTKSNSNERSKHSIVNLVFDSLSNLENSKQQIQPLEVKMVQDILQYVDHVHNISPERAQSTLDTIHHWVEIGRIKFRHFERNPNYLKLCQIVEQKSNKFDMSFSSEETNIKTLKKVFEYKELEDSYSNMCKIPTAQVIKILSGLAIKQQRNKPLLTAIATNIIQSEVKLSIKTVGDILYSLAILNFPDEILLQKLCRDLKLSVYSVSQSSVIGSIVTSLGMLRYRDTELLDMISKWAMTHRNVLRTQDLCSLIMTLAIVGHNPINSKILFKELVSNLKETDMTKSSEWLDIVWSLTLLDQVTSEQLESVLNKKFIDQLNDPDEPSKVRLHKLLNINAAAKLLIKDYSGNVLPEDCEIINTPMLRPKHKQEFVKAITDTLINLFPSKNHFHSNIVMGTGFVLDVEFFLNEKCAPLPLDKITEHTDAMRIAVVANNYHDYCKGENTLLGPVKLHLRLLESQGYRVLDISHEEFHINDKLLTRIAYINHRIKSVVK